MNKSVIAPVVGVVCLGISAIFHKDIPSDVQDSIVGVIVLGASVATALWGIFKNHNKTE